MKKIDKIGAQGDVLFIRVDTLPKGLTETEDRIVAHSETGHHHTASGDLSRYTVPGDDLLSYIVAKGPVQVEHHRPWDTHETLELLYDDSSRGETIWEIRRQREWSPAGWRRVED